MGIESGHNIRDLDTVQWFQNSISQVRQDMLDGKQISGCQDCYLMEKHGKVSGRQKQLLKIGVTSEDFDKSMLSSQWLGVFEHSVHNHGNTEQLPQDWEIDLGNFCNSACVFCNPGSSSRLASEFKTLGLINKMPPRAWCTDPALLESFIGVLKQTPQIAYLHFLGGEPLLSPAFETILHSLVEAGLAHKVVIGLTTGLACWNQNVVNLMKQFRQANVGMSVECFHPLNDYVRYGSHLDEVKETLQQWIQVAQQHNWLLQLRVTPTVLSVWHLDTVYKFAFENGIAVESCNFLRNPDCMRPSVLTRDRRDAVIHKLQSWTQGHNIAKSLRVVNTRDPNLVHQQLIQDANSYIQYLMHEPDESHLLPKLVEYLKLLEKSRGNHLLDYLPEYESLLKPAGY